LGAAAAKETKFGTEVA